MKAWMIYALLIISLLVGGGSYIHYSAIADERSKQYTQQLESYKELKGKYDSISAQYQTLKAKKEQVRTVEVIKEDRIINENKDYYAGECFDSIGLQHIRESQLPK